MRTFFLILLGLSLSTNVYSAASVPQLPQEKVSQEKIVPEKVLSHPQKEEVEHSKPRPVCDPNVTAKVPQMFN
ncbi:MAG: hypothetical protein BGO67_01660 [Alphaproteobacteria bacterium 41-28]|nr:MAG: hypothetical protein BGO67_01660 [Alphaproteobacteria bacterium 41-28]